MHLDLGKILCNKEQPPSLTSKRSSKQRFNKTPQILRMQTYLTPHNAYGDTLVDPVLNICDNDNIYY